MIGRIKDAIARFRRWRSVRRYLRNPPHTPYTFHWTGEAGDGDWLNLLNWDRHEVPGTGADIYVGSTAVIDAAYILGFSTATFETDRGELAVIGEVAKDSA